MCDLAILLILFKKQEIFLNDTNSASLDNAPQQIPNQLIGFLDNYINLNQWTNLQESFRHAVSLTNLNLLRAPMKRDQHVSMYCWLLKFKKCIKIVQSLL